LAGLKIDVSPAQLRACRFGKLPDSLRNYVKDVEIQRYSVCRSVLFVVSGQREVFLPDQFLPAPPGRACVKRLYTAQLTDERRRRSFIWEIPTEVLIAKILAPGWLRADTTAHPPWR
jgi:hypothetical protein